MTHQDKAEILEAIYAVHEATEMRFNAVDAEFAAQNTRMDRLERDVRDGFAATHEGFAGVNQRLDRLERTV